MRLFDLLAKDNPLVMDENTTVICGDEVQKMIDDFPLDFPPDGEYPQEWYGNVAPPWESYFVESFAVYSRSEVYEQFGSVVKKSFELRRGVLFKAFDVDDSFGVLLPYSDKYSNDDARWALTIASWTTTRADNGPMDFLGIPSIMKVVMLDANGYLTRPLCLFPYVDPGGNNVSEKMIKNDPALTLAAMCLNSAIPFALKTINMIHESATIIKVNHVPKMTRQLKRKLERNPDIVIPRTSHYVVHVRPKKTRYVSNDVAPSKGSVRGAVRKHLIPGRFRFYGPEWGNGLLFGKYAGAIWVPTHERGSRRLGVIKKDYEVHKE